MQTKLSSQNDTECTIAVVASPKELQAIKEGVVKSLSKSVKMAGFRSGKAPLELIEKQLDQTRLQQECVEEAINQLYPEAVRAENVRPVSQPTINLTKFVPYDTLEFSATFSVIADLKIGDYKNLKAKRTEVAVEPNEVEDVLKNLQRQSAEKKDVTRAAKDGDQVWIDFEGKNAKGEPIPNADGKDYPLALGSKTFIPGFEDELIGTKPGDEKTFTLTFPKDYGSKDLAGKKVTFTVSVTKVQEVVMPKVDNDFAKKLGPFETAAQLKKDIEAQLLSEKVQQANLAYETALVRELVQKSSMKLPKSLVDEQVELFIKDQKQNLVYKGQTYEEYLKSEGKTDEEYRKELVPQAEERLKASFLLAEIAEKEKLDVTPEELESRIQALKSRYSDETMRAELDKPSARREIAHRMLSEKTVALLASFVKKV